MPIDFEALLGSSPNPYVIMDPDFTLVWMNEAYLRVTMRSREDIIGRKMFDAFPSDPDTDSFRQLDESLRRTRETGETDEIALIRYDIARPDGSMDVRYWSATHTPLLDDAGRVEYILQHTVDVTELHNLRRLRDEMNVVRRADAVEARNRSLQAECRRMTEMFEQAPGFVAVLEGDDHRFRMTNEAYLDLVGRRDIMGLRVRDALPEVVDQGFLDLLDRVRSSGEPYVGRREMVLLDKEADAEPARLYLNFIFQPIFADDDSVTGIMIQGYDITEEVEYEQRQRLLINELNHRVKNTLAIVQGLASQSFSTVEGTRGAQAIFNARLQALAAAHNLLTQTSWGSARLADIVASSAEATAGDKIDRFDMEGPTLTLPPQVSVSLAMIIHELCTNAIKYGALSNETGRIAIEWSIIDGKGDRKLTLQWRETGGPPVEEPKRSGFGTRLIARGLSSEDGSVDMDFRPEGLVCTIETVLPEEAQ
ncbi:sensor histidine kinase [Aurantiacibacter hainanensis]|uniref:sensor histidine kinase n=1 Tax=Aurantiacibacter hainanensis TaxID=3076114 RepID=UPI0030C69365